MAKDRKDFEAMMDVLAGVKADDIHYGFGLRLKEAKLLLACLPSDHAVGYTLEQKELAKELHRRLYDFIKA